MSKSLCKLLKKHPRLMAEYRTFCVKTMLEIKSAPVRVPTQFPPSRVQA